MNPPVSPLIVDQRFIDHGGVGSTALASTAMLTWPTD
jgi:hypothetical protein